MTDTDTAPERIDKLAAQMGFAARCRHDVSEDAIEWWAYTGEAKREELRKMARLATRQRDEAVGTMTAVLEDIWQVAIGKNGDSDKVARRYIEVTARQAIVDSLDATAALERVKREAWNEAADYLEEIAAEKFDPWATCMRDAARRLRALNKGTDNA